MAMTSDARALHRAYLETMLAGRLHERDLARSRLSRPAMTPVSVYDRELAFAARLTSEIDELQKALEEVES